MTGNAESSNIFKEALYSKPPVTEFPGTEELSLS